MGTRAMRDTSGKLQDAGLPGEVGGFIFLKLNTNIQV